MNLSNPVSAVAPSEGFGSPSKGLSLTPLAPVAAPELVGKFEALMARTDSARHGESGHAVPAGAVSKVEGHLKMYTDNLDNVLKVADGKMSLIDLQALQVRSIAQVGIMSMTHTAYVQVLGAGKGSVSSLMKNQ
jgi:hypothetical protein